MKYCTNCGTQLPDEAVFCGACGCKCEPLVIETKEKVLNIEISDNPPAEWNQSNNRSQPEPEPASSGAQQPGRKRGAKRFWLFVVIAIVVAWLVSVVVNTRNGVDGNYHPNQKTEKVRGMRH